MEGTASSRNGILQLAQEVPEAVFSDHRQLVTQPDIDVVAVTVRVPFHRELVSAAIAAGKAVNDLTAAREALREAAKNASDPATRIALSRAAAAQDPLVAQAKARAHAAARARLDAEARRDKLKKALDADTKKLVEDGLKKFGDPQKPPQERVEEPKKEPPPAPAVPPSGTGMILPGGVPADGLYAGGMGGGRISARSMR